MRPRSISLQALVLFFSLLAVSAVACSADKRVVVLVDGERRVIDKRAPTVGDLLREQQIVLGDQARVEPPDYTPIERTAIVLIVRVALRTETTREPLGFGRIYTREENLPESQVRVSRRAKTARRRLTIRSRWRMGKRFRVGKFAPCAKGTCRRAACLAPRERSRP